MPWMPAPAHYSPYISLVSDHGYLVSLAHSTLAPSTISRSGCVRGAILTRTTLLACPAPSLFHGSRYLLHRSLCRLLRAAASVALSYPSAPTLRTVATVQAGTSARPLVPSPGRHRCRRSLAATLAGAVSALREDLPLSCACKQTCAFCSAADCTC
jgi:hypothetical protein